MSWQSLIVKGVAYSYGLFFLCILQLRSAMSKSSAVKRNGLNPDLKQGGLPDMVNIIMSSVLTGNS